MPERRRNYVGTVFEKTKRQPFDGIVRSVVVEAPSRHLKPKGTITTFMEEYWEKMMEVVEEPKNNPAHEIAYLVSFLRACAVAADQGELGVDQGKLLVNGDLMREAADALEEKDD
jgi:hypothetical protein